MLKLIVYSFYYLLLMPCAIAQTSTIPSGSSWKYLDDGSNQGSNWRSLTFKDSKWKTGNAKFGYGISDAATVISFGTIASKKHITTYFRKNISISDPTLYSSFTANVMRDDGVVVYINGKEVYRNNIPSGTVSHTTLATEAADNGNVAQSFSISASAFNKGNNVIAVEVHQASANTPDMAFDLELIGMMKTSPPADQTPPTVISINRQSPTTESTSATSLIFRVTFSEQVKGVDATDYMTAVSGNASGAVASAVAVDNAGSTYDVAVGSVSGEGTIRLDLKPSGTGISDAAGNTINGGYTSGQSYILFVADQTPPVVASINRQNPASETTTATAVTFRTTFSEQVVGVDAADFTATATSGSVSGILTSNAVLAVGTNGTVYDITVSTISGTGTMRLDLKSSGTGITDVAGNAINGGYSSGQSYIIEQTSTLPSLPISFKSSWRYLDDGTNQGSAWRTVSFEDRDWKTGNGKFGYGISDAATTVSFGPDAKKKHITTYFRSVFSIEDATAYSYYAASISRDDGVIVYINDIEVYRNNMPTGAITHTTLASASASDNGAKPISVNIANSAFVSGPNVIAIEIHQSSSNTPDMAFDMELVGKTGPLPVAQPEILYYEGFESGTGFAGMHLQSSTTYGFTVVSAPTYHEKNTGRFELRKGDLEASRGTRTEVLFTEALAQETTWHSFAAYFPSDDYADDALSYEVYNQWHQGSTWGTPMLMLRIKNGRMSLNRRSYSSASVEYDLGPQPKDQWVKFVIHLKQHTTDGFMKIWVNNVQVLHITGETMFPDTDPVPYGRWKMGIYKSDWNNGGTYKPSSTTVRVWYVDEVKIGNAASNYEMMEPAGNNISILPVQASSTLFGVQSSLEEYSNSIKVYPTVTKRGSNLTIDSGSSASTEVFISDVAGRVHSVSRFTGSTSIETNNLASGIYFIRTSNKRQSKQLRFIVTD